MPARILVIDDEATWYELFKEILSELNFEVDIVQDFGKAKAFLKNSTYHLVLADVCLDKSDFTLPCQEFFYFLHNKYPNLPVLAMTGKLLTPPEMWTLSQSGVIDFIYKNKLQLTDFRRSIQSVLQKTSPELPQKSNPFKYDVFISYSHQNKDRVRNWLLQELESAGLRVCIDFRDFDAGVPMLTEMERAITQSRKTLLILTPDYLQSGPAEFENILVQTVDLALHQHRLIPLLLEPCDPSTLPFRLRSLAYLDFTEPDKADLQFEKLIATIKS